MRRRAMLFGRGNPYLARGIGIHRGDRETNDQIRPG
jgi:hypothetical protein